MPLANAFAGRWPCCGTRSWKIRGASTTTFRCNAEHRGSAVFDKILIANRGEIACRVIKICAEDGHQDGRGLFRCGSGCPACPMADEAVHIGPPPSAQSYLSERENRAGLPGYRGRRRCIPVMDFCPKTPILRDAGPGRESPFIGPRTRAIQAWATRSRPRSWPMRRASIPSRAYRRATDAEHAVENRNEIGYPVMLKATRVAAAKGMRMRVTTMNAGTVSSGRQRGALQFR